MADCSKCKNADRCETWDIDKVRKTGDCEVYKPIANADKIRSMSDEELAEFLHNIGSFIEDGEPLIEIYIGENKSLICDSVGFIEEWLQSEAE